MNIKRIIIKKTQIELKILSKVKLSIKATKYFPETECYKLSNDQIYINLKYKRDFIRVIYTFHKYSGLSLCIK